MKNAELNTFLLNLNGVSRVDIKSPDLKRYLVHDLPFAVFVGDNMRVLNIKLNRGKIKELTARFKNAVSEPEFYDPFAWVAVCLDSGIIPDSVIYEVLLHAYMRLLKELSALSRVVYLEKDPIKYDLNYNAIIKSFVVKPKIEYGKKLKDLE